MWVPFIPRGGCFCLEIIDIELWFDSGFTLIITTLFTIAGIITALLASGTLILGAGDYILLLNLPLVLTIFSTTGALLTVILGVTFFTALFSTATFLTIFAFYKMGVAVASGRDIRESIPPWVMGRGNLALTQNSVDVKVEPPTPSSTGDWQAVEGQSSKQDTL